MSRGQFRIAVAIAVLAGLALRLWGIDREALWIDEAVTVALARMPLAWLLTQPIDPTPGAFYALQHLFVPDPASAGAARAVALVFGTLTIAAAAWLGRLAGGRLAGAILAALVAVFPAFVDQSIEARAYAMLLFGVTLSSAGLLAMLRSARDEEKWGPAIAGFAAGAVIAGHAHLVGMLWAALASLLLLALSPTTARRRMLLVVSLTGLAILPAFLQILAYSRSTPPFWAAQPSLVEIVRTWSFALTAPGPAPAALKEMMQLVASSLILIAGSWTLLRGRAGGEARDGRRVALLLLAIPIVLLLVGAVAQPVFLPRTVQASALGGLLLLALALARIGKAWPVAVWIIGFLALSLVLGPSRAKEDWRAVARTVGDGQPVQVCPHYLALPLEFAAREQGLTLGPLSDANGALAWPSRSRGRFGGDGLLRWSDRIKAAPTQPAGWTVAVNCTDRVESALVQRLKTRGTPEILVGRR